MKNFMMGRGGGYLVLFVMLGTATFSMLQLLFFSHIAWPYIVNALLHAFISVTAGYRWIESKNTPLVLGTKNVFMILSIAYAIGFIACCLNFLQTFYS